MSGIVTAARLSLVPLVLAVAFFVEQLDATIIVAALPAMARSLGTSPLQLNIAITGYVLALALVIPLSGWTADRVGARKVFTIALGGFSCASLLCGLSTSLAMLVGLRVVQGVCGGMMTPVGRLILIRSFPREQLPAAMSRMAAPMLIGPALGPLLGGLLTSYASWRWIFYVNVPIGVIGAFCAWRVLPDIPPQPPRPFDRRGFVLCASGIALIQATIEVLQMAGAGWWRLILPFGGIVLLCLYAAHARRTQHPVLDLGLFRIRAFLIGVVCGGLSRVGLNAAPFLLPLMLQLAFGWTALQAGGLTFLSAVGAILTNPATARLLGRLGYGRLLIVNALLAAMLLGGFAFATQNVSIWLAIPYVLVFGMVRSVQFASSNALSYAEVPPARLGPSVSLAGVAQQLGMSFGVGLAALSLARFGAGHAPPLAAFRITFLIMALFPFLSVAGFLFLNSADGRVGSPKRAAGAT